MYSCFCCTQVGFGLLVHECHERGQNPTIPSLKDSVNPLHLSSPLSLWQHGEGWVRMGSACLLKGFPCLESSQVGKKKSKYRKANHGGAILGASGVSRRLLSTAALLSTEHWSWVTPAKGRKWVSDVHAQVEALSRVCHLESLPGFRFSAAGRFYKHFALTSSGTVCTVLLRNNLQWLQRWKLACTVRKPNTPCSETEVVMTNLSCNSSWISVSQRIFKLCNDLPKWAAKSYTYLLKGK